MKTTTTTCARPFGSRSPSAVRRRVCLAAVVAALGASAPATAAVAPKPADAPASGGRVGWARLITPFRQWSAHAENDPELARFIRTETSLNMDPTCDAVTPASLDHLCAYPFIFSNHLATVSDPLQQRNLREYLQRGGFLYIDACANPTITPDFAAFYRMHHAYFTELLPGCDVRKLPETHPLYRCYFSLTDLDIQPPRGPPPPGEDPNATGLHGVFVGERMVALISLGRLQCGWPNKPARMPACMQMIVNIHVFAMTR